MIDELSQLAKKYGSDRHPGSKHSYTPYYDELFGPQRKKIKKVLEIGVGEGRGLRMWRDFFPNAQIYGAEVDQNRVFKDERIEVIECDQTKSKDLDNLIKITGTDFDFIVEDGSHAPQDQVFTCQFFMPFLKKDALYIIEDVADVSIVQYLLQYDIQIPKLLFQKNRYDDHLIVVKPQ